MALPKENTENTPDQTVCTRKTSGLMENPKEYMKSFFHASLDEHKVCFKATLHKMIEKFQEGKPAGMEVESSHSKN